MFDEGWKWQMQNLTVLSEEKWEFIVEIPCASLESCPREELSFIVAVWTLNDALFCELVPTEHQGQTCVVVAFNENLWNKIQVKLLLVQACSYFRVQTYI